MAENADLDCNGLIDALGRALMFEFGEEYAVYDEEVKQGVKAPCFFVSLCESKERLYFGFRYFRENRFLIQYYPKGSNRKKRECDEVSERLFDCLLWIRDGGEAFMGRKMRSEYEKGVLSFFVNYDMFIYRKEDRTLMGELSQRSVTRN